MSGLNGYRGKDGKVYNDWGELTRANNLWDQQQKQNELLNNQNRLLREGQQEQNRLLEEQNRLLEEKRIADEKQREEERRLERERIETEREIRLQEIETEKEIEESRQEHEKEMRFLKLCDEAGINKGLFDSFIFYISNSERIFQLRTKLTSIGDLKNKLFIAEHSLDLKENAIENKISNEINIKGKKEIEKYNKLKNNFKNDFGWFRSWNNFNIDNDLIKNEYEILQKKFFLGCSLEFVGFLIFLIPALISPDEPTNFDFFTILMIIILSVGIIFLIVPLYESKKFKKMCDEEIKNINTNSSYLKNNKAINDITNYMYNLKSTISQFEKTLNDENNKISNEISNVEKVCQKEKLEEFYNFRVNHYNPKIEKLLLDFGFDVTYKDIFKSINKSQSKSMGEIDDYIEYFSNKTNELTKKENYEEEDISIYKSMIDDINKRIKKIENYDIKSGDIFINELNKVVKQTSIHNNEINDEKKAIIKINYNSPAKSLKIFVNDEFYNKIENESRVAIELEKGKYNIRFKDGSFFKSSEEIKLNLNDGDYKEINIDCWGSDYKIDVQEKKDMDETSKEKNK